MVRDRSCDCCQVRRLLPSRRHGIWAGWSGYDLHTHTGSVSVFTRPLKDDKIQCRLGVGSLQAVHERIFFFPLSLPFSPVSPAMFVHSCMHRRDRTQRKRRMCVEVCHRSVRNFSGSRLKSQRHSICTLRESFACRFHRLRGCLS